MHIDAELKTFTADDVDNLFRLNGNPEVMRYLTGGRPTPRERIRDEVIPFHLGVYAKSNDFGSWAALARDTSEFLGWFHFRRDPPGARGTRPRDPGPSSGTARQGAARDQGGSRGRTDDAEHGTVPENGFLSFTG